MPSGDSASSPHSAISVAGLAILWSNAVLAGVAMMNATSITSRAYPELQEIHQAPGPNCISISLRYKKILSAKEINTLRNGIILRDSVHTQFVKFTIALKPTDIGNEYEGKTYKCYPRADIPAIPSGRRVLFLPNTEYEIPSPAILDSHWRVCEIFNASAMGETIE
ncbi:uncharacterized protein N7518_009898 [Penicillium psychrosexuale]|uniref:uncharacterized protein n=1 Tax=Penicillium psychrosexuale TaxID=1002107 RepID=UPI0025459960|nr:uncharacterized protein N7518_009898 [Penicillium psychrosexuale]KAJ5781415.1 hypothetical protein N7518_009898 [Penicillium psychrosexuale]